MPINSLEELGFSLYTVKYSAVKITNADYTDDLACCSVTILLHQLEKGDSKLGIFVNAEQYLLPSK